MGTTAIVATVIVVVGLPFAVWAWLRLWHPPHPTWRGDELSVSVSRRAANYVKRRGGVVYVWTEREQLLRAATERPPHVQFESFDSAGVQFLGFQFLVECGFQPAWVRVDRDWFPPWHLLAVTLVSPP